MEIKNTEQFNQGIGKYKVLSSNAGVGSIVATKWGGFVMPLSSSKWGSIFAVSEYFKKHSSELLNASKIYEETGVEIIDDNRFVGFLRATEGMNNLRCLVAVPHITLDAYNKCNVKEHPANIKYKESHPSSKGLEESTFTIPAVVFPRWFFSRTKKFFKPVEEWIRIWKEKGCNNGDIHYFAPPRDPYTKTGRRLYVPRLQEGKDKVHELLEQSSMVLICPNGHISDIPWQQYFSAKLKVGKEVSTPGFDLFNYEGDPCPGNKNGEHELQWLENRSHTESFGMLKCKCCEQSVSLEGIMNLQPLCPGDKPWEGIGKRDYAACMQKNKRSTMRWALVTSNSVYYAENFSSLFIPDIYRKDDSYLNDEQSRVLDCLENKWYRNYLNSHPNMSKEDYLVAISSKDECSDQYTWLIYKADDSCTPSVKLNQDEAKRIINIFLGCGQDDETMDVREQYRFEEFEVFQKNSKSLESDDKLIFNDIELPEPLRHYFYKIQQVSTLGVSNTQINFSRVSMPQPELKDDGTIDYPNRMKIFSEAPEDVLTMPAVQSFGEGLFFSFNEETMSAWMSSHEDLFKEHYKAMNEHDDTFESIYREMKLGGIARFLVLHTFSHILMKELEFSCGYPTASMSERLYFSDRMCGVLIYTTDGAEGSMGGLVWQGQPELIENIIRKAMQRAMNCASDPICWENEDQLNYAACFSCAMVSETSCEKRNVGLDRRILVDGDFGYFKDLI